MAVRKSELSTTQHHFLKLNNAALLSGEEWRQIKGGGGPISDQIEYHAYAYLSQDSS
jgi:hypothetical protein